MILIVENKPKNSCYSPNKKGSKKNSTACPKREKN
jgi:hypothetical protein